MTREIFVVARNRPDLYRYLSQTFADAENVQVIWDRRNGERRRGPDHDESADGGERRSVTVARTIERRRAERRTRATAEQELRAMGYVFITI
jgi:hypothetical protein